MKSLIKRCKKCRRYTLKERCPVCNSETEVSIPVRFSPEDPYGRYRRLLRKEKGFFLR